MHLHYNSHQIGSIFTSSYFEFEMSADSLQPIPQTGVPEDSLYICGRVGVAGGTSDGVHVWENAIA